MTNDSLPFLMHKQKFPKTKEEALLLSLIDIKYNIEIFVRQMPVEYKKYYKNNYIVSENKLLDYKTIIQPGIQYFETINFTHFILPTQDIIEIKDKPDCYAYIVTEFNPVRPTKMRLLFKGTDIECATWVLKKQEEHYGINIKNMQQALGWLKQVETFMEWVEPKLDTIFANELRLKFGTIRKQVREELNMPAEEDIPETDIQEEIRKAKERNEADAQKRRADQSLN